LPTFGNLKDVGLLPYQVNVRFWQTELRVRPAVSGQLAYLRIADVV
jgi:hypothetical protein